MKRCVRECPWWIWVFAIFAPNVKRFLLNDLHFILYMVYKYPQQYNLCFWFTSNGWKTVSLSILSIFLFVWGSFSVRCNMKIVTTHVQDCALLAKYYHINTPFCIRMVNCAVVKHQLSSYKCVLHVEIQKYGFTFDASLLSFLLLGSRCSTREELTFLHSVTEGCQMPF